MKRPFLSQFLVLLSFFVLIVGAGTLVHAGDDGGLLFNSQMKRYPGIANDEYLMGVNVPMTLEGQYYANKEKFEKLRANNQKILRLYDEEKLMNQSLRKMLSKQIEEEFRLRAEFKKLQKEFETRQADLLKAGMALLSGNASDYETIKDQNDKITNEMTGNYERYNNLIKDNYTKYMEYQKLFKQQQEDFYKKQVEFYEKVENAFNKQMERYEDIQVEINEVVGK